MYRTVLAVAACIAMVAMVGCGSKAPQPAGKTEGAAFTASVKMMDPMSVASVAKTGPYTGVGQAIGDMFTWMGKAQVKPMGAPFGVFLTGPEVPQESAKWEVCIPVPAETKGDKDVMVRALPAMQLAATMHTGPFEKVGPAYEQLMKWVDENGYMIAGPAMEFYLSDPSQTPADSLQTEIAFVVQAKPKE